MIRLILSPHIDDETIALGGSIARWVSEGDRVIVVSFFTGGSVCKGEYCSNETRLQELREVSEYLGFESIILKGLEEFEDRGQFAEIKDAVASVEKLFIFADARVHVYFPTASEHQDHVFVNKVGNILMRMSAVKTLPHIYGFYEYSPYYDMVFDGIFIDITKFVMQKKYAMRLFKSQVRENGAFSVNGILECNAMLGSLLGAGQATMYEKIICRRVYE